jgi:hypothetical protein
VGAVQIVPPVGLTAVIANRLLSGETVKPRTPGVWMRVTSVSGPPSSARRTNRVSPAGSMTSSRIRSNGSLRARRVRFQFQESSGERGSHAIRRVLEPLLRAVRLERAVLFQNLAAQPRQRSAAHQHDAQEDREHKTRH